VMTRATNDIDVLADVLLPPAKANLSDCVRTIQQLGFKALDQAGSELLHRFVHPDGTYIDVLAPDHQSWAPVTVPPRETVRIPGGTQALQRAELVRVIKGDAAAEIAVPSLLGALVLKAAAFKPEKVRPERHVADAAFLASLIADPIAVKEQFRGTDFARILYLNKELEDPQHPAWMDLGEHHEDALTAWRILCREPDNPQTHNGR
jgi:predicted RNA binding protein YcfA (HicA-like mRNA interferase family)